MAYLARSSSMKRSLSVPWCSRRNSCWAEGGGGQEAAVSGSGERLFCPARRARRRFTQRSSITRGAAQGGGAGGGARPGERAMGPAPRLLPAPRPRPHPAGQMPQSAGQRAAGAASARAGCPVASLHAGSGSRHIGCGGGVGPPMLLPSPQLNSARPAPPQTIPEAVGEPAATGGWPPGPKQPPPGGGGGHRRKRASAVASCQPRALPSPARPLSSIPKVSSAVWSGLGSLTGCCKGCTSRHRRDVDGSGGGGAPPPGGLCCGR